MMMSCNYHVAIECLQSASDWYINRCLAGSKSSPAVGRGRSSGVEHHVANVRVVSSNLIARSKLSSKIDDTERNRQVPAMAARAALRLRKGAAIAGWNFDLVRRSWEPGGKLASKQPSAQGFLWQVRERLALRRQDIWRHTISARSESAPHPGVPSFSVSHL